jgi:hypothetical protein
MRGKDFSTGLRGGLFEQQHYTRMGAAIWLYGWLVLRQTNQHEGVGFVLGGKPIPYREIEEETGFNRRTLERWMRDLRRAGYIETKIAPAGVMIRITKAKKFPQLAQGGRKFEGGARTFADPRPQSCVADEPEVLTGQQRTSRMNSLFLEESIEKQRKSEIHRDFHKDPKRQKQERKSKPPWLGENQNPPKDLSATPASIPFSTGSVTRTNQPGQQYRQLLIEAIRQRELLRAEREEEVRRELAVGTGPELQRS